MTSSATPVVSLRPDSLVAWPELAPRFETVRPDWEGTRLVGIGHEQTSRIVVLDWAFNLWNAIGANATTIAKRPYSDIVTTFCPAGIRPTRTDGRRYSNAAVELRELLAPELTIASIAGMCGVSERGFYNWLDGKGIRESRSRRLMELRSLVRALKLQRGRDGAISWLLKSNPALDSSTPMEAIKNDEIRRVLPLAVQIRPRSRQSILPTIEDHDAPDSTEALVEQGRLDPEVYDLL